MRLRGSGDADSRRAGMSRRGRKGAPSLLRALLAAGSLSLVSASPPFLVGALAVQLRADLDFSPTQLGIAAASFRGVVSLSSAALGRVADLTGPSRAMRASVALTAVAALTIGLFVNSWEALVGCLVLAGVGSALGGPAMSTFIARAVRLGRRGIAFGIQQAGPPGAALVGGFAVPLVALTLGWRWAFGATGILTLLVLLLIPGVATAPRRTDGEPLAALPLREPVILAAAMAFGFGSATTMSTFLVESAVDAGIGKGEAGLVLALGGASSIGARLITGRLADRWAHSHLLVAAWMLAAGFAGYLLLATGSPAAMVIGTIIAFSFGWGFSAIVFFAVGRMYPENPGAAAGMLLTGGSLGGIVTPVVFGYILETTSYGLAWTVLSVWAVLAAALLATARLAHNRTLPAGDPRTV
ncbi:MAG: MFS transporter [bacterium]|nr:MFS transporter [bacterium]